METHEENEAKNSAGDEITGLNAEETYKVEKQLAEELLFGGLNIETPTIDDYARRNGLDAK